VTENRRRPTGEGEGVGAWCVPRNDTNICVSSSSRIIRLAAPRSNPHSDGWIAKERDREGGADIVTVVDRARRAGRLRDILVHIIDT